MEDRAGGGEVKGDVFLREENAPRGRRVGLLVAAQARVARYPDEVEGQSGGRASFEGVPDLSTDGMALKDCWSASTCADEI